jgi:hypothetical protein
MKNRKISHAQNKGQGEKDRKNDPDLTEQGNGPTPFTSPLDGDQTKNDKDGHDKEKNQGVNDKSHISLPKSPAQGPVPNRRSIQRFLLFFRFRGFFQGKAPSGPRFIPAENHSWKIGVFGIFLFRFFDQIYGQRGRVTGEFTPGCFFLINISEQLAEGREILAALGANIDIIGDIISATLAFHLGSFEER